MLDTIEQAIGRMEGFYAIGSSKNRPQRNHNPGNIEYGKFALANGAIANDSRFAIFPDDSTGFAALKALLKTPSYIKLTVAQAINKYAPPSENNTANYVAFVCKRVGCTSDTLIKDLV